MPSQSRDNNRHVRERIAEVVHKMCANSVVPPHSAKVIPPFTASAAPMSDHPRFDHIHGARTVQSIPIQP